MLAGILKMLGLKDLKVECDRPETVFKLDFTMSGRKQHIELTAGEIIDELISSSGKSGNMPGLLGRLLAGGNHPEKK